MINKGKIVYHKQVIFEDGILDNKQKRPCVVLFELEYEGKSYVCTCPFTSNVDTFNKLPKKYKFVPEQIYQYRKLSFAKLDSTRLYPKEETFETNYLLMDKYVDSIIEAIMNMPIKKNQKRLEQIKKLIEYEKLFIKLEEKELEKEKRKLKKQKKKKLKKLVS